jgi:glutaredoxin
MTQLVNLTLIGKPGCHLCDDARLVVNTVIADFKSAHTGVNASVQVQLDEHSILENEALFKKYSEEIPVLLINDKVHNYWRIDPIRLRDALESLVN